MKINKYKCHRMCLGKTVFWSAGDAMAKCDSISTKGGPTMRAYQCPNCFQWHITKQSLKLRRNMTKTSIRSHRQIWNSIGLLNGLSKTDAEACGSELDYAVVVGLREQSPQLTEWLIPAVRIAYGYGFRGTVDKLVPALKAITTELNQMTPTRLHSVVFDTLSQSRS